MAETRSSGGGKGIYLLLGLVIVGAVAAAVYWRFFTCTPIGQIVASPAKYDGKTVHVRGTVGQSLGLFGKGGYRLSDRTGRIMVVTSTGIPPDGEVVDVRGVVKSAFTRGDQTIVVLLVGKPEKQEKRSED